MSTYVLIPGMNHGGWCFDDLAAHLRAEGHTVHALTLPEHVDSVVYLDAFVPHDGENCWMQTNDDERAWYADDDGSGSAVPALPFFDERALANDPAWEVHVLESKHNVMRDVPGKLAAILLDVAS